MKVPFVKYGKQYLDHKEEFDNVWEKINSSGNLILRGDIEEFEENLANFVGTKYAVALNSGTDALKLAYEAAGLGSTHWSISIPSHTFKSTAGAAKSVHKDISIDVYDLGEIPKDSDIAVAVHIAGEIYPQITPNYFLIEDAAQALGALKNPTSFVQTWSFYPAKILGARGDAGALTTNDLEVYNYAKEARNHFKGDNNDFGMNSRMDNLQAAILNIKFKYLSGYIERREEIAQKYKILKNVELPNYQEGRVWQDYIIRTSHRDELYDYLKEQGIETMKNEYPWTPEFPKLPLAEKYEAETLRIPCTPEHTYEEIECVIYNINYFFEKELWLKTKGF